MKKYILLSFFMIFSIVVFCQKGNIWYSYRLKAGYSYYDSYFLSQQKEGKLFLNIGDTCVLMIQSSFTGFDISILTQGYCKYPSKKICKVFYKIFDSDKATLVASCNTTSDTIRLSASNIRGRYLFIEIYTENALIINRRMVKFWE